MKEKIVIFLFCLVFWQANAQSPKHLCIKEDRGGFSKNTYKVNCEDSLQVHKHLNRYLHSLRGKGYYLASIDSICYKQDSVHAFLYRGKRYKSIKILNAPRGKHVFSQFRAYEKYRERLLKEYEDNGFPFASIQLDTFVTHKDELHASILINEGKRIIYDSITIFGDEVFERKFLHQMLKIQPGNAFSASTIKNLDQILKTLPYIKLKTPVSVIFADHKALVKLHIEKRKNNELGGMIGLVPNGSNNNRVDLVGEINTHLFNLFKHSHELALNWKKPQGASQHFDANYDYRFFLKSHTHLNFSMEILKQDSSFIWIDRAFKVYWDIRPGIEYGLLTSLKTSYKLEGNVAFPDNAGVGNFRLNYYGMSVNCNRLDDIKFPRRGVFGAARSVLGNKQTDKGNGEQEKTLQLQLEGQLIGVLPLYKNFVGYARVKGAMVSNQSGLFINDYFNVGGLNSLRGYYENEFKSAAYLTITTEFRWYMQNDLYFNAFFDQGFLDSINGKIVPKGIGVGISFATKGGLFDFQYALGGKYPNWNKLNLSRIHFGFRNIF